MLLYAVVCEAGPAESRDKGETSTEDRDCD